MTISSIQNEEANCSIKNEQLRYFSFLHAARDFSKCIKNLGDRNMLIFYIKVWVLAGSINFLIKWTTIEFISLVE